MIFRLRKKKPFHPFSLLCTSQKVYNIFCSFFCNFLVPILPGANQQNQKCFFCLAFEKFLFPDCIRAKIEPQIYQMVERSNWNQSSQTFDFFGSSTFVKLRWNQFNETEKEFNKMKLKCQAFDHKLSVLIWMFQ